MSRRPLRVFIDTNVWFSAFYGSQNSEKLLKAHVAGKIRAVISQQVLNELVKNVREKIPAALTPLQKFLEATPPEIIGNPTTIPQELNKLTHPKDAPIIITAIQAHIAIFVTGNIRHFRVVQLKKHYKILVLTPKQAVVLFKL